MSFISNDDNIWDQITVIRKTKKQLKKDKIGHKETVKRTGITNEKSKMNTLDNATETVKHKTIPLDWGKKISEERRKKNMSQKDLAKKINVLPSVINQIECGKALMDHKVLTQIEQKLNIKVRSKK